jgi:2-polyprenyl-3-methyl-5-hydroxy-6-metoxy-1,4-benzoquinol methylase
VVELLAKYLKPGGRLVISTPNVGAISKVLALLIGRNIYHSFDDQYRKNDNFAHIHEYTKGEISEVVTRAGLEVEEFIYTTYGFHAESLKEKFNHYMVMPLKVVPCFREGMIIVAKKSQ